MFDAPYLISLLAIDFVTFGSEKLIHDSDNRHSHGGEESSNQYDRGLWVDG
jgi:hypothetical protein